MDQVAHTKAKCSSGRIDLGVGVEDEAGGVLELPLADQQHRG